MSYVDCCYYFIFYRNVQDVGIKINIYTCNLNICVQLKSGVQNICTVGCGRCGVKTPHGVVFNNRARGTQLSF